MVATVLFAVIQNRAPQHKTMSEQIRRKSELRKRYETEWGETAPEGDSDRLPYIPWLEGKLEQWDAEARDTNDPQVRPMTKMEHSLMDAQAEIGQLEAKLQLCRELGADETINYATNDFQAEVMRITNGAGVRLALDAVGGEVTEKSMKCLAAGASLVNYGNASNQPASLPMADFREGRWATGFSLVATFPTWDNPGAMADVMGMMRDGKIKMIVDQVLPMSEAAKGHAHLSARGAMGKVLLVP